MLKRHWGRFSLEAAFIVAVAVAAAFAKSSLHWQGILAVMAGTYLLVVAVEFTLSRGRGAARPAAGLEAPAVAGEPVAAEPEPAHHVRVLSREEPAAEPEPQVEPALVQESGLAPEEPVATPEP